MTNGNCVAKLAYGQYGWEAHQSLAPELPKLFGRSKSDANVVVYVMEYLPRPKHDRPGWIMLFDLADNLAAARLEEISQLLQAILTRLKNSGFVHGDLRPNNLMIKMAGDQIAEPLDIKVVDFEWAGRLNEALMSRRPLYPRNFRFRLSTLSRTARGRFTKARAIVTRARDKCAIFPRASANVPARVGVYYRGPKFTARPKPCRLAIRSEP